MKSKAVRERKCEGKKIQRVKKHHSKNKIIKKIKKKYNRKKLKIKTPHTKPNIYLIVLK